MSLLRSALTLAGVPLSTMVHATPAMIAAFAGAQRLPDRLTMSWGRSVLALGRVTVRTVGLDRYDPSRTCVLVANHLSHFDVPAIVSCFPGPIRFVGKQSLFDIPGFGHALRALGHIPVQRGNTEQARESLERSVEPLRTRVNVLFFAEGTRSEDGSLGPFKRGALAMAEVAGVPLLPIGVSGTRAVLPSGSLRVTPGTVALSFGAPLEGLHLTDRPRDERLDQLREAVAERMAEAAQLRAMSEK